MHIAGGTAYWGGAHARAIARAMLNAAQALGIPLEWGGNWPRFPDTPHFQLPWAAYPLTTAEAQTYVA